MSKRYYFTAVQSYFDSWKDVFEPKLHGPYDSAADREKELRENFQGDDSEYGYIIVLFTQDDTGNLAVDSDEVFPYFQRKN